MCKSLNAIFNIVMGVARCWLPMGSRIKRDTDKQVEGPSISRAVLYSLHDGQFNTTIRLYSQNIQISENDFL